MLKNLISSAIALAVAVLGASEVAAGPTVHPWAQLIETADGNMYRVPANSTRMLDVFGSCIVIGNLRDAPLHVPTKNMEDYKSFSHSFLNLPNRDPGGMTIQDCPSYFFVAQGCTLNFNETGVCMIKEAHRNITPGRANGTPRGYSYGGCRVGTVNWGEMYYNSATKAYHPGLQESGWTDMQYYSEKWADGRMVTGADGSMVIPSPLSPKLFNTTVNLSGVSINSRLNRIGWSNPDHNLCRFYILTDVHVDGVRPWGDVSSGGGKMRHNGDARAGENGAVINVFTFIRYGNVPDILTDAVIDTYMIPPPPWVDW